MVERLLAAGSVPELVTRRCVLGNTLHAYFKIRSSSLPVVVASIANRSRKRCSALARLDRRWALGSYARTSAISVALKKSSIGLIFYKPFKYFLQILFLLTLCPIHLRELIFAEMLNCSNKFFKNTVWFNSGMICYLRERRGSFKAELSLNSHSHLLLKPWN